MTDRERLICLLDDITQVYHFDAWENTDHIADHLIANGVTFETDTNVGGKWISVKDRLPEESGNYIVGCDDSWCPMDEGIWYCSGVVVCAEVDVGVNGGICWEWREGETLYDLEGIVTHWMPLPEPPEEGNC